MIPEDYVDEIVSSGINFMNAITRAYGAEEGMKLYDSIMMAVDSDIKGKIFFSLLTGDSGINIKIKGCDSTIANKVERIKALRYVSMFGLLDAKNTTEAIERGESRTIPHTTLSERSHAIHSLRRVGFII